MIGCSREIFIEIPQAYLMTGDLSRGVDRFLFSLTLTPAPGTRRLDPARKPTTRYAVLTVTPGCRPSSNCPAGSRRISAAPPTRDFAEAPGPVAGRGCGRTAVSLRRGDAQLAFPVGREGQAGADVIPRQIGEIAQNPVFGHPGG